ncbi:hypothetical protein [Candidatus Nitrosacidococcus tergens]|nr:hypothetical protein [Candidatus Nitrosacidococcus tergens]
MAKTKHHEMVVSYSSKQMYVLVKVPLNPYQSEKAAYYNVLL